MKTQRKLVWCCFIAAMLFFCPSICMAEGFDFVSWSGFKCTADQDRNVTIDVTVDYFLHSSTKGKMMLVLQDGDEQLSTYKEVVVKGITKGNGKVELHTKVKIPTGTNVVHVFTHIIPEGSKSSTADAGKIFRFLQIKDKLVASISDPLGTEYHCARISAKGPLLDKLKSVHYSKGKNDMVHLSMDLKLGGEIKCILGKGKKGDTKGSYKVQMIKQWDGVITAIKQTKDFESIHFNVWFAKRVKRPDVSAAIYIERVSSDKVFVSFVTDWIEPKAKELNREVWNMYCDDLLAALKE